MFRRQEEAGLSSSPSWSDFPSGRIRNNIVVERTDSTISLRPYYIRQDLFIQVFYGEVTESLYVALVEGGQRIFGADRDFGEWHFHPYDAPHQQVPFPEGLGPKPLLTFLARVEKLQSSISYSKSHDLGKVPHLAEPN